MRRQEAEATERRLQVELAVLAELDMEEEHAYQAELMSRQPQSLPEAAESVSLPEVAADGWNRGVPLPR